MKIKKQLEAKEIKKQKKIRSKRKLEANEIKKQ